MTKEYAAAIEAHSAACVPFYAAQKAYRLRQIGDAEFLAARAAFNVAQSAFDVAYQAAQDRVA